MTEYKEFRVGGSNRPFGFLGPLLILAVFFGGLFFLAKGIFWLFSWIAPFLLIAALILDYKVVTGFLKFIWGMLNSNPIIGIVAVLLTFFGYPFVSGYLFFKALSSRTIKKTIEKAGKESTTFTPFEEVEEEDESFLQLPSINQQKETATQKKSNEYDEMFKQ